MKLHIVSDIHLELTDPNWKLPNPLPEFDVMIVAGDLVPGMDRGVAWLEANVPDKDVIFVAGNHEFYGARDIDATLRAARERARGTRIHVLSDETVTLNSTTFIGSTLWTDFALLSEPEYAAAVAAQWMNDYREIHDGGRLFRPSDALARHRRSRAFIREELAKPRLEGEKHVVVTHHGIHSDATRPGLERDLISSAYTTAMEAEVAAGGADLWAYGHVHVSDDRIIGRTRVVSNPKAYGPLGARRPTHGNPHFDPRFVVEI